MLHIFFKLVSIEIERKRIVGLSQKMYIEKSLKKLWKTRKKVLLPFTHEFYLSKDIGLMTNKE